MRNHGQCEGKLLYNSFSIIQLQTFCTEHLIPLESVPIQNTHSSVSDKEKKANRHETGPDRFIERIAEGNIDTPAKAKRVKELGVFSIVVGSIITRPQLITKAFVNAIEEG